MVDYQRRAEELEKMIRALAKDLKVQGSKTRSEHLNDVFLAAGIEVCLEHILEGHYEPLC